MAKIQFNRLLYIKYVYTEVFVMCSVILVLICSVVQYFTFLYELSALVILQGDLVSAIIVLL